MKDYKQLTNAYSKIVKPDLEDKIEVEIGDVKQPDTFHPQVKIKRWDNEINLSVRLNDEFSGLEEIDGKIKLTNNQTEAHFYQTKVNDFQDYKDLNLGQLKQEDIQKVEHLEKPFSHILINDEIWGRDTEEERQIRLEKGQEAFGDVLIVGLGLGVINEYLLENPRVTSITIVELSQEIIDLVKEKYPERLQGINLIKTDFYDFAKTTTQKFDYIWGDIFHNISVPYFKNWERFKEASLPLLKVDGVLDGRIKESYESIQISSFDKECYEFEVLLKEKPSSNTVNFSIQTKGLKFYYQPELTQVEKDSGCLRLPYLVGSYAVYHDSKSGDYSKIGGKNYRAGKAFHIYRPKIEDAEGNWVWGELNIDVDESKLIVTISQDFLNNAVYPIRHAAGLTFGYSGEDGTDVDMGNNIRGSKFTGGAGTGESFHLFISPNSAIGSLLKIRGNVYLHSDLSEVANTETFEDDLTAGNDRWYVFAYDPAPTFSAVDYVLCMFGNSTKGGGPIGKYDTGDADQGHDDAETYPNWPDPLIPGHSTRKYAVYVTYAAAGEQTQTITAKANIVTWGEWSDTWQFTIYETFAPTIQALGRIKLNVEQTITAKGRIEKGVEEQTQTVTSKASIQKEFIQLMTAKGAIKVTTTQIVASKSRIQKQFTQTINAKGRIEISSIQTITSKGRITQTFNQTIQALGRISKGIDKTLTALASIKKEFSQTIQAKSVIQKTFTSTIQSKGRITKSFTQTIESKARILGATIQIIDVKANIKATQTQTITSRASVKKELIQTIEVKGRIQFTSTQTIQAKANIFTFVEQTQTIESKGRIQKTRDQTINAKAQIGIGIARTVTAKGRITSSSTQTITSKARITILTIQTITVKGRIGLLGQQSLTSKGSIKVTLPQTITVKGRIKKQFSQTITTLGSIQKQFSQTIESKGRVGLSSQQTINAKASIHKLITRTINAKAQIGTGISKTITAKARIQKGFIQTLTTKARIEIRTTQTIQVKAHIHIPWYWPTTLTITKGAIESGELKNVYIENNQLLTLEEVTGTPGFDYELLWENLPDVRQHVYEINAYYSGPPPTHLVLLYQWNWNLNQWDRVTINDTDFPYELSEQYYEYVTPIPSDDYIQNGQLRLRIYHPASGNPNQRFIIDRFVICIDKLVEYITAKGNIRSTVSQTITAVGRIKKESTQNLTAKGRIQKSETSTINSKGRIEISSTQTINAKGNIKSTQGFDSILTAKGSIGIALGITITAKGRIQIQPEKTINAKGKITSLISQTIETKGDIKKTTSQNVDVKASIQFTFEKNIQAKANVIKLFVKTITAKGAIATYRVVEIIDRVRDQKLVNELTYVKEKVGEVSYNKVEVASVVGASSKVRDIPRTVPVVKEIYITNRVIQIKWITTKARIRR